MDSIKKILLPNMIGWYQLPQYVNTQGQEIRGLQISKEVVGEIVYDGIVEISEGTSFIIGKQYSVDTLEAGDDFTNIGFVSEGTPFIATGTTPTEWSNGSVVTFYNIAIVQHYNSVDSNIYIKKVSGANYEIKITNGGFVENKTFPNIVSGSAIDVVDTNTIAFNAQNTPRYFKIEVFA